MDSYQKYYKKILKDLFTGHFYDADRLEYSRNDLFQPKITNSPNVIYLKDVIMVDISGLKNKLSELRITKTLDNISPDIIDQAFRDGSVTFAFNFLLTKAGLFVHPINLYQHPDEKKLIKFRADSNGFKIPAHLIEYHSSRHHIQLNPQGMTFKHIMDWGCKLGQYIPSVIYKSIFWNSKTNKFDIKPKSILALSVQGLKQNIKSVKKQRIFKNSFVMNLIMTYKALYDKFTYSDYNNWQFASRYLKYKGRSNSLKAINHSKFIEQLSITSEFLIFFAALTKSNRNKVIRLPKFNFNPDSAIPRQSTISKMAAKKHRHNLYDNPEFAMYWSAQGANPSRMRWNEAQEGINTDETSNLYSGFEYNKTPSCPRIPNLPSETNHYMFCNVLVSSPKNLKDCLFEASQKLKTDAYYNIVKFGPHLAEVCIEQISPRYQNLPAESILPAQMRSYFKNQNSPAKMTLYNSQPVQTLFGDPRNIKYELKYSTFPVTGYLEPGLDVMSDYSGALIVNIFNVSDMNAKDYKDRNIAFPALTAAKAIKVNPAYRSYLENL